MTHSALWDDLHELLRHRHIAGGHDALDSVNRLLRKNLGVKEKLGEFQLARNRAEISEESWDLPRLVALLHPSQMTSDEPAFPSGPVAIVRRGALEFLVDGRRRINHWSRSNAAGPYRVLVVSEKPQ